ncbi:hypothetical protein [Thalassotalea insulae]|uniref:hypothetical protein n=1 Tax=Thalassotalea insulae TaxID=2056778 RepID=UPI0024E07F2A|nr:hypothetical protein [Thalassotalea insulae]
MLFSLALVVALAFLVMLKEAKPLSEFQSTPLGVSEISSQFKLIDAQAVLLKLPQATRFNHFQQLSTKYLYVVVLAIFFISVVNYRFYQKIILLPPWYVRHRYYAGFRRLGWKISNLLYQRTSLSY